MTVYRCGKHAPDPPEATEAEREAALATLAHVGWTSARRGAELARMNERRYRLAIAGAVLAGSPVLSGPDGYRLTDSPTELRDAAGRMRAFGAEIMARASALERTAEGMVQPSLDLRGAA